MRRLLFIVWVVVIVQIAAWAFAPEPAPPQPVAGDGRGFGDTEKYTVDGRARQRQDAIAALELPWSSRCAGEERKRFIGGLNEYYYHRQNQMERYPETFGKAGADYIATQWSTTDDRRIDRLIQDAYARGYLKPADFDGVARKMVANVVTGERVTGNACAG
jgi:hypothetical protein